METIRARSVSPYDAPGHHGMVAFRLQGRDATANEHFWVGLSLFLPGGGAERAASATEKVYVLLDGEITVITDDETTTLRPMDSCRIAPGEFRSLENRGHEVARMLVVGATCAPGAAR